MNLYRNKPNNRIATVLLAGALICSAGVPALGQPEDAIKTIGAPQAPQANIGLEAYREVVASGRYIVGPGDEFLVYVPGIEEPILSEVLAEGGLFIPKVGLVQVGGLEGRRVLLSHHFLAGLMFQSWVQIEQVFVAGLNRQF